MLQRPCRVLVLGASGQFGKRLCNRLIGLGGLVLLLGGRDEAKLAETRAGLVALRPGAAIELAPCDVGRSGLPDLLRSRQVNLVVHLAGPFQGQDYKVALACLEAGVPYIDMADGREFVAKFASLDAAARAKGIALVTGASTVPGLSSAVVDAALPKFTSLRSIDYGISASLKTGLGSATLQAVLSYCGKPYEVLDDGKRRPRSTGSAARAVMTSRHPSIAASSSIATFPIMRCSRRATPTCDTWDSAAASTFPGSRTCCR